MNKSFNGNKIMAQIEGKFYPLQHDEWVRACQELTPSQRDVLYFIRTLDPYGNGVKITAAEIARQLSTDRKTIHRQTISRALKELDAKGFIDIELVEVRVKIKPKGYWCDEPQDETHSEAQTVCRDTDGASGHQWCDETPQAIATHQHGSSDTNMDRHAPQAIATHHSESETQSPSKFQNSKMIKTYTEFKKTLSEGERENFLNFVREQIKNLPKQVNDVEAWLANQNQAGQHRWEIYYNNFLADQLHLKQRPSGPREPRGSEIKILAAECRRRWAEEISKQRIAAERASAEKTATPSPSQLASDLVASEPVKEKLAELLSPDPSLPPKKRDLADGFRQWKRSISQQRIDALSREFEGGTEP
jgi:Fe2+ or Zn2+ uptake regulation protein